MSSIKHLNREIKRKRMEGKLSANKSALLLTRLLVSAKSYTRKNPFKVAGGIAFATIIMIKYQKKINYIYPIGSLGFKFFKQFNEQNIYPLPFKIQKSVRREVSRF